MSTQSIENVGKIYRKVGTSSSKFCLQGRHRNQHKQRAQKKKLSSSLSLSLSLTLSLACTYPLSRTATQKWNIHTPFLWHTLTHLKHRRTLNSKLVSLSYGAASSSRLIKIIGLFCKRALWKRRYSAKETCNFKEPTNLSPIRSYSSGYWHIHIRVTHNHPFSDTYPHTWNTGRHLNQSLGQEVGQNEGFGQEEGENDCHDSPHVLWTHMQKPNTLSHTHMKTPTSKPWPRSWWICSSWLAARSLTHTQKSNTCTRTHEDT